MPSGPFRRIWLPVPSLFIYLLAWASRITLWFVPSRALKQKTGEPLPIDKQQVGRAITRSAWILLCSGPYVLCDVSVAKEGVKVKITVW